MWRQPLATLIREERTVPERIVQFELLFQRKLLARDAPLSNRTLSLGSRLLPLRSTRIGLMPPDFVFVL
jgi:hypothetical protein